MDHGFLSNDGRVTQFTLMGNALYDFQTGTAPGRRMSASASASASNRLGGINFPPGVLNIDSHATVFNWQGIAGLEYAFNSQLRLGIDYRYIGKRRRRRRIGQHPRRRTPPATTSLRITS
ncbi:MAG: hypothetical protein WDN69_02320 [Aliidongia sp.]